MNLKVTPLFEEHKKQKAKILPFAGWKMPIYFSNAKDEHLQVRESVGLFDVSHMGEIRIQGDQALDVVSYFLTNDISKLQAGQCQYNFLCNDEGGIIDDLIVYCIETSKDYLLCVNANCSDEDFEWIQKRNPSSTTSVVNESDSWGQIAVQGPKARELTALVLNPSVLEVKKFHFQEFDFEGVKIIISRTGYTGEDGFEILCPASHVVSLWKALLGQSEISVQAIGLAARDTLRLEMKYPLNRQDMHASTSPLEMGMKWALKNPRDFIGKQALQTRTSKDKWVGFELLESGGIPRAGYTVLSLERKPIGKVTSGALSPSLNKYIGTCRVPEEFSLIASQFFVEIHGKPVLAKVVKTPFYTNNQI